jgi:hypothetical protein
LNKKIAAFTASGSWTVPAGVTYAIAHMIGGGGSIGQTNTANAGGDSSVAFASGTVASYGGTPDLNDNAVNAANSSAGPANSGRGATGSTSAYLRQAGHGQYVVAGAAVTPAASITVTVGAGGAAGTNGAAGGSGYVFIEYYE